MNLKVSSEKLVIQYIFLWGPFTNSLWSEMFICPELIKIRLPGHGTGGLNVTFALLVWQHRGRSWGPGSLDQCQYRGCASAQLSRNSPSHLWQSSPNLQWPKRWNLQTFSSDNFKFSWFYSSEIYSNILIKYVNYLLLL